MIRMQDSVLSGGDSMKRLLSLMVLLVLACGCAAAEAPFFRIPEVLVARKGSTITINYQKTRSAPAGNLMIQDASGNELATAETTAGAGAGRIVLRENVVPDRGQTLTLWFTHDGHTECQGEILLAVDDRVPAVKRVETSEKKIAVTFDSTGNDLRADKLLSLLERYGVKSTFFIMGGSLKANQDYAVRITANGHELANHSMYHPDMREIGNAKILWEIRECNDIIRKTTGQTVRLYRPPSGYCTRRDLAISRALGCEVILWTFDSNDGFDGTSQKTVLERLRKKSEPGAIILMHDYGRYTIPALEIYIPEMQAQGYEFVTVSELLKYSR